MDEFWNPDNIIDDLLLSSNRGHHPKVTSLIHDEEFQMKAREYVRENAYVRGKPNLTALHFAQWVKKESEVEICEQTARFWLQKLGFSYQMFSKGVFFDGHERADVIEHRNKYLETVASYSDCMLKVGDQLQVHSSAN